MPLFPLPKPHTRLTLWPIRVGFSHRMIPQAKALTQRVCRQPPDGTADKAAAEQPYGGAAGDAGEPSRVSAVSLEPIASEVPEVSDGAGTDLPGGAEGNHPDDDHRGTGNESSVTRGLELDAGENAVEVIDAECAEPETGRDTPSSAMDVVAAGIVNRALFCAAIAHRALPAASHAIAEAILVSSDVEIPAGTRARIIRPMASASGVEHADGRSVMFVPDDGCSPIYRVAFKVDGTIAARLGPYRSGT